jgi:hypothetical protein
VAPDNNRSKVLTKGISKGAIIKSFKPIGGQLIFNSIVGNILE